MQNIRDKTEQVLTPIKADLIWFVILLLAVAAAVYGIRAAYHIGYNDGVVAEKIGFLEDADIARQE